MTGLALLLEIMVQHSRVANKGWQGLSPLHHKVVVGPQRLPIGMAEVKDDDSVEIEGRGGDPALS